MSENIKTPFEKAKENARVFIETADMMQSLSQLKKIIDDAIDLTPDEQEGINVVVEATLKTLSNYLVERGHEWN
tara:strand:+ start:97 stop:318 length:222 start_codon:yes stop_codon:yes gene_type:complete